MAVASLIKSGWPLDEDKLRVKLDKIGKQGKIKELLEWLLSLDLACVSRSILPTNDELQNLTSIKGPIVLQLSHWQNVSHSVVQNHTGNTGVCRLTLSDGHRTIDGFSTESLGKLSGKTPYGSKVLLKSTTKIEAGLLLLNRSNVDLLGGDVPELKSLWEKERMQIEVPAESSNNAPKWVSIDCYEDKKREAEEICKDFNSFKCFAEIPYLSQQKDNENSKTNTEFKRKRQLGVDSIVVPRKRPRFLFHKYW